MSATQKYNHDGTRNVGPGTLGYYVFDLPNGEVIDILSPNPVVLPENLSNLTARYVERPVTSVQGVKRG
jgi:hypothetical protein